MQSFREKLKWIDPFHYVDIFLMPKINPKNNELLATAVYFVSAFVFAWLFLFILSLLLGTQSPLVIVMSGSMEPVLHRGDIVVMQAFSPEQENLPEIDFSSQSLESTPLYLLAKELNFSSEAIPQLQSIVFSNNESLLIEKQGPIVIYYSEWQRKPIIHRAIAKLKGADGLFYLTKGDSLFNNTVDQHCGRIVSGFPEKNCINFYPVNHDETEGRVIATIPLLGCAKIWIVDDLASLVFTGRLPEDFKGVC